MKRALIFLLAAALVACGKREEPRAATERPQLCVKAAIVDVYEEDGRKITLMENVDVPDMEPKLRFRRNGLFGSKGETILLCEYT